MIDNNEIEKILDKLESLDDEALAVELLKEFNSASSELGRLLLNLDDRITHDDWKSLCDKAQKRLNQVVKKIDQC